jgi:hypothetical protein
MGKPCQWFMRDDRIRCDDYAVYVVLWYTAERKAAKRSCRGHIINWILYAFDRAEAERIVIRPLAEVQDESRAVNELREAA